MTKPGCSIFNSPSAHVQMNEDIQELIPWLREARENTGALWCALSNVCWRKGDLEFGVTFRGAGAYVGELYMGTEEYEKDSMNYNEFSYAGSYGVVHPKIGEYLRGKGWTPYTYGPPDMAITEFEDPCVKNRKRKEVLF